MRYFDHDSSAASDDKIMALRLECGGAAVDAYWALLEKMYRDEQPLRIFGTDGETNAETKAVSHRLCVGCDELKTYVSAMLDIGLFEGTIGNFWSTRAIENIEAYQQKVETARQNGKKGGRKPTPKPKGNRVGSSVATNKETKSLARKEKKVVGNYSLPTTTVADGADADKSAPPAPVCPLCGLELQATGIESEPWWCNNCSTGFSAKKVCA